MRARETSGTYAAGAQQEAFCLAITGFVASYVSPGASIPWLQGGKVEHALVPRMPRSVAEVPGVEGVYS
jgi:hypothetical protein